MEKQQQTDVYIYIFYIIDLEEHIVRHNVYCTKNTGLRGTLCLLCYWGQLRQLVPHNHPAQAPKSSKNLTLMATPARAAPRAYKLGAAIACDNLDDNW